MQVFTEEMVRDLEIIEYRMNEIKLRSICTVSRTVMITIQDEQNLASDLVKLDRYLYWTDLKELLSMATILLKCNHII